MAERYARMEGDTVIEVFDFKPVLHASLEVVEVPIEVDPNWSRDSDGFHPPAPPVIESTPAGPVITYKADIYRRCTDDEADAIEMALAAAPVRQRRLFESALHLDHSDDAFAFAQEALVGMFGEKRASELLAAS